MKHPIIIYLVILIVLYLGLNGYWAVLETLKSENSIDPFSLVFASLSLIAAIALYLRKNWSKYLIYSIALLTSGTWLLAIYVVAQNGWPYATIQETIISLIPGFLLLTICICGSIVVHKYFKSLN